MTSPSMDRLCIHTATTKPLSLQQAVELYGNAGVRGITVWEDAVPSHGPVAARRLIKGAGLSTVALCRGGFFVSPDEDVRNNSILHNESLIRTASELGAPLLVLVCGAHVEVPLPEARQQIRAGIEAILPLAQRLGVRLAVEPLHPMYADARSAVNTMRTANDLVEAISSDSLGIAVDVYHVWWDPDLPAEISRCGERILAFHVSDWRSPTRHLLTDRALMGDGCIPIREIRAMVERAGFSGFVEVEVFSEQHWAEDQADYIGRIVETYQDHV